MPWARCRCIFLGCLILPRIEINPGRLNIIKGNTEKPVTTSDFIHAMLDLANIQTDYNKNTKSFFNEQYHPSPREICLLDKKTALYDDLPAVE